MKISEGKLRRMKALSNERGVIAAAAMDQRGSLQKALATARGVDVKEIKHAFVERIGAECETWEIPFFLEFVGYDPKGGDERGVEYAKAKPEIVKRSMEEFTKPQYHVDVLKVEVPVNAEYVEGSSVYKGP